VSRCLAQAHLEHNQQLVDKLKQQLSDALAQQQVRGPFSLLIVVLSLSSWHRLLVVHNLQQQLSDALALPQVRGPF
jgi:hypothetical protein